MFGMAAQKSTSAMWRLSLLGVGALLAVPAEAADLPARKAAPVDYVRICSVYGAGFWYIPGTDTCVRIAGYVRAEFAYGNPANTYGSGWGVSIADTLANTAGYALTPAAAPGTGSFWLGPFNGYFPGRDNDASGFRARTRLNIDTRTETEWGTLRTYIRYELTQSSGVIPSFSNYNNYNSATSSTTSLEEAYVEWGGLRAGKAQSVFDFYANAINFTDIAGSDVKTIQFRYGVRFGNGYSAGVSIEDPTSRKTALYGAAPNFYGYFDADASTGFVVPYWQGVSASYGGTRVPDIIAAAGVEQDWGTVKLSGALHQSRFAATTLFPYGPVFSGDPLPSPTGLSEAYADSQWGYALQAGAKLKLPWLAQGDVLWLQAAYANGAINYLEPQGVALGYGVIADQFAFPVIGLTPAGVPYYTGTTTTKSQSGYALTAAFLHYWTPTIRQGVFGSFVRLNTPSAAGYVDGADYFVSCGTQAGVCALGYGPHDTTVWQLGTNLIWSPVSGLDIGLELGYINSDSGTNPYAATGRYANYVASDPPSFTTTQLGVLTQSAQDRYYARFRIQRDF
jgi:hypothetical protein